ncbi:MAG: LPXTG cell wall anchor domain-containing protein [Lachnospiraceae bacterium]|nr:LPXTG cell wall anchor domain-containing protein [Lachnospiraceae bacterium]
MKKLLSIILSIILVIFMSINCGTNVYALEPAPEIHVPDNLTATQDDPLSKIILPDGWTWVDDSQTVTVKNSGYPARLVVDDERYDYTGVEGYDALEHYVERILEVVVAQGKNEWKVKPSMNDWTYGEKAGTPKGTAKHGKTEFTYGASKKGTFHEDIPSKAGTWYMKATVPESDEYEKLEEIVKFTIYKAKPNYSKPSNLSAVYGDTLKSVQLPKGFSWTNSKQSAGNVGTHQFKAVYTPSDTANYETVKDIKLSVKVAKASNKWTKNLSIKGWTYKGYDKKKHAPKASAKFGKVSYTYSSKKTGTYKSGIPTTAGTWYVKATVKGTSNYKGLESKPVSFKIAPKDGTKLSIPTISKSTNLKKLQIKDGKTTLVSGRDYTVTKKQSGSTVKVQIAFKGNYKGTVTKTYRTSGSSSSGISTTSRRTSVKTFSGTSTSKNVPKTGDRSNLGMWSALLVLSAGGMVFLLKRKRIH